LLEGVLAASGLQLPDGVAAPLALHAGEMLRWNRSIRLTAITDPLEVSVKHVLDSLLPLRLGPFEGELLDVGSGAGYPGIPLALCLPGCRVTMVEAVAKKCAFISRAAALLGLRNVEVIHGRVERKRGVALRPFATVISRATFPPEEAVPLLAPRLAPGGRLLLMTGADPGIGALAAASGLSPGRTVCLPLPYSMGSRTIGELLAP
jgi:16S rRNA (guanine527-N7)-methyltransferase